MDPNLFHLDWERVTEVLAAVVVLSFVIERALAIVFEHKLYLKYLDGKGLKEAIAFVVCALVCVRWDFDAVSMVLLSEHTTRLGELLTAGLIAGGSKAPLALFHDFLNLRSTAHKRVYPTDPVTKRPSPQADNVARAAL